MQKLNVFSSNESPVKHKKKWNNSPQDPSRNISTLLPSIMTHQSPEINPQNLFNIYEKKKKSGGLFSVRNNSKESNKIVMSHIPPTLPLSPREFIHNELKTKKHNRLTTKVSKSNLIRISANQTPTNERIRLPSLNIKKSMHQKLPTIQF